MKIINKLYILLSVFFFAISFSGCGEDLHQIRYDVPNGTATLDPQYAQDDTAKMIITNTYEGLLRKTSDGEIVKLAADDYSVSEDGKIYTFKLKPNLVWSDGSPVTADDFVFTFERIMDVGGKCPFSSTFSIIKNSAQVSSGGLPMSSLGVSAVDNLTVRFELSEPDTMFTEKLTNTAAVPTNRKYFQGTKGKYGMDTDYILSNGPFKVSVWDNTKFIILKKSKSYYDKAAVKVAGMNIHIGRQDDKLDMIANDKADAFPASFEEVQRSDKKYISYEGFNNKVWVAIINPNSELALQGIDAALLTKSISFDSISANLPDNIVPTKRLLPSSARVGEFSYIENTSVTPPRSVYKSNTNEIRRINVLIQSNESIKNISEYISQSWQKEYSLYSDITYADGGELSSKVASGDFDVAIIPIVPETSSPSSVLYDFKELLGTKYFGLSAYFDNALAHEDTGADSKQVLKAYETLEQAIISSGIASPMFSETDYFITSNRVSGIEFFPYSNIIYIKNASAK